MRNVLSTTWIFSKRADPLVRSLPATVIIEVHPSERNGRIYQLCTSSSCYNRTPRSIPFFSSKVVEVNIVARASQSSRTDRRINSNNSGQRHGFALGFFAPRIGRSEMECSGLGFSYVVGTFHQSKWSDNK